MCTCIDPQSLEVSTRRSDPMCSRVPVVNQIIGHRNQPSTNWLNINSLCWLNQFTQNHWEKPYSEYFKFRVQQLFMLSMFYGGVWLGVFCRWSAKYKFVVYGCSHCKYPWLKQLINCSTQSGHGVLPGWRFVRRLGRNPLLLVDQKSYFSFDVLTDGTPNTMLCQQQQQQMLSGWCCCKILVSVDRI